MAQLPKRDRDGGVIETPREATQAENSKNSFGVLALSMTAAAIAGVLLLWYFGAMPGMEQTTTVQPGNPTGGRGTANGP